MCVRACMRVYTLIIEKVIIKLCKDVKNNFTTYYVVLHILYITNKDFNTQHINWSKIFYDIFNIIQIKEIFAN